MENYMVYISDARFFKNEIKIPLCVLGNLTEEALGCSQKLLDIDSRSGPALIILGIQSLQERNYNEAEKKLTEGK